jgi:hypothetical protein
MPIAVFVAINAAIYTFCAITLFFSLTNNALAITFAWIFALGMLLNGLGHIGIMAFKRSYFPGGITAFLLVLFAVILVMHLLNIAQAVYRQPCIPVTMPSSLSAATRTRS